MDSKFTLFIIAVYWLLCGCMSGPEKQDWGVRFEEPEVTEIVSPIQNWDDLEHGVHVAWGSSNERYHREYIPDLSDQKITLTVWKGERVNAQMVTWSKEGADQLKIKWEDLKSENSEISTDAIHYYFVRNVLAEPYFRCGKKAETYDSTTILIPDILSKADAYHMEENSTRGIWIILDIPSDAMPGEYLTTFHVLVNGEKVKSLNLSLTVQDQLLPPPQDWEFHLDLWQNPFAVARYYDVELWSDKHFDKMKPMYKRLAETGQKCITATIMYQPWGWVTYDYFDTMVRHIKKADGTWSFDYDVFDKWVSFMMDLGIDEQINCYTMVPWAYKFRYYDEAAERDTLLTANPTSQEYEDYWTPFLISFKTHLKEKGLYDITTIAMDERPMDEMKSAFQLVEKYLGVKITSVANYTPEFSINVYDFSVAIRYPLSKEFIDRRKKENLLTTFYTSCGNEYPNSFTFSPPVEAVWQGWFAFANHYDGILRWAYNSWNKDPMQDTRHERWGSGDAFLIYPDNTSSIRFEKMREGIQDYEKLRIISQQLKGLDTEDSNHTMEKLNSVLQEFEVEQIKREGALSLVNKSKALLNKISE